MGLKVVTLLVVLICHGNVMPESNNVWPHRYVHPESLVQNAESWFENSGRPDPGF